MTETGPAQQFSPPGSLPESRHSSAPSRVQVCLSFQSHQDAARAAIALSGMLLPSALQIELLSRRGLFRDDLSRNDVIARLQQDLVQWIRFSVDLPGGIEAHLVLHFHAPEQSRVTIELSLIEGFPIETLWLQCDPDINTPFPVLMLPTSHDGLVLDSLHGLIAVAATSGGFVQAMLTRQANDAVLARWLSSPSEAGALPVSSILQRAVWSVGLESSDTVAWFVDSSGPALSFPQSEKWWLEFEKLLTTAEVNLLEIQRLLDRMFVIQVPWQLQGLRQAESHRFHSTPPKDVAGQLLPASDGLIIAVDLALPSDKLGHLLVHLCAHAELGHIRSRDDAGHWDTLASLDLPHRRWDRDAWELVEVRCPRPRARTVQSLEECNALEKAWLALHHQISQVVGEPRTLHKVAIEYQNAAYQRQAAQRLVAQLEEFGGAMLCDGVGLGKTYVATTIIVHYANTWLTRLAEQKRDLSQDPFRITVLSPNSVVSTWRREALPPLEAFGVSLSTIRVISHTKLSRIQSSSQVLEREDQALSDLEHLLVSDLVIVDEAHNFRSEGAKRTAVLRDFLRLQPRRDLRRKVLLLTATPVNNSLEDLRQQTALLFSKPTWFNENTTVEGYRGKVLRDIADRIRRAKESSGDVAAVIALGKSDARFSSSLEFRNDLDLGEQIARIGDYLKEQEVKLQAQQQRIRDAMVQEVPLPSEPTRVGAELLDRIVVQRSRNLCKQIEREDGSNVRLLFRPDATAPEKLVYEDAYDGTLDVLAQFLPLFDSGKAEGENGSLSEDRPEKSDEKNPHGIVPLSLKVYMWSDVRDDIRDASESSSVIGLQRILVLKRLESSPVSLLVTLLRLLALHAHRLHQLLERCRGASSRTRKAELLRDLESAWKVLGEHDRAHLDLLLTGSISHADDSELLTRWNQAHESRPIPIDEEEFSPQLTLFPKKQEKSELEELDRLWRLKDDLTRDFQTLLTVAPDLARIVFGRFAVGDWPKRFIAGGAEIDWPTSSAWGLRMVTDAKLRRLTARLLQALAEHQKAIVFSQFSDTLEYLNSVFKATAQFKDRDWRMVLDALSKENRAPVSRHDVQRLTERVAVVSGDTEDRDTLINTFAPFYRLGVAKRSEAGRQDAGILPHSDSWSQTWIRAMTAPVDVLLASDVLAEGVNLQDASLLINYDVHWNPVRMIQRAGRIDRRLNPAIEDARSFPDLEAIAQSRGCAPPRYWWHDHPGAAPITVNLLLPEELEAELQLRERIANKTLAIDFTLGLEQGTGAEAEWMANYRYQGISSLNAWQQDRAIEQVAGYQERLRHLMLKRGMDPLWVENWYGWIRETEANEEAPLIAWARVGLKGKEPKEYSRYLTPKQHDGVVHWLWTTAKPKDSLLNFWLILDGVAYPARARKDLPWSEDASRPLGAADLLHAASRLVDGVIMLEERGREVGKPVQQGVAAIAAGYHMAEADRRLIDKPRFRLLQLAPRTLLQTPSPASIRRGISRACSVCGRGPGMHKCCPSCKASAQGELAIDATFGFRRVPNKQGIVSEVPQTWCRVCRQARTAGCPPDLESEHSC